MNFVSWAFAALVALVLLARVTIGRRKVEPAFVFVLLVASLVFYGWHVPAYLLVLLGSATIDFIAARAIARRPAHDWRMRRAWLVASLVTNLGLLAFFKYGNFASRAIEDVAAMAGATLRLPELALVLPMGISFYTFQTLSYTIDVYRGRLAPVRSFGRFLLYISFFPQLVAGPIVRATEFLPQMGRPRRLRARVFYHGVWLVILGFFLKMVCADNLAAYVDEHWFRGYRPETSATFSTWLAVMFSGQIFADFAGYSTIAQGLGYLLGYRLPRNFDAPYVAGTFKNFWERWHITLSRWLRDYLYVPLGGNRGSRVRTFANLIAVMVLGGLWHGAAYTFVVWGAIHGACLAAERGLGLQRPEARVSGLARAGWSLVVQVAVLVAWVFFRSDSVGGAATFVANIARGTWTVPPWWMVQSLVFLMPIVVLHVHAAMHERGHTAKLSPAWRAVVAAAMTYGILTLHGGTSDFIYFQF
jgi:alginate O-acetyltransferase complex protein AlgI